MSGLETHTKEKRFFGRFPLALEKMSKIFYIEN